MDTSSEILVVVMCIAMTVVICLGITSSYSQDERRQILPLLECDEIRTLQNGVWHNKQQVEDYYLSECLGYEKIP